MQIGMRSVSLENSAGLQMFGIIKGEIVTIHRCPDGVQVHQMSLVNYISMIGKATLNVETGNLKVKIKPNNP